MKRDIYECDWCHERNLDPSGWWQFGDEGISKWQPGGGGISISVPRKSKPYIPGRTLHFDRMACLVEFLNDLVEHDWEKR